MSVIGDDTMFQQHKKKCEKRGHEKDVELTSMSPMEIRF